MAMDGSDRCLSSPSSSSSSHDRQEGLAVWSKRPAGRTKFKETRHPVYRGVRSRGAAAAGRWVCEVRVPGAHGKRLWLGTHLTAESAGRAHDAAMLALLPSAAACLLNFPDSAAATPPALGCAAVVAVAGFLSREAAPSIVSVVIPVAVVPVAVVPVDHGAAGAWPSFLGVLFEVPLPVPPMAMGSGMLELELELDMPSEMDLGMHYADLAEGLLMEPPPDTAEAPCWESGDYGHGDAGDLWSY
ncbi:dehydration-responsive element-binding protein 1H [Brachypodium distachyon]|uniref:AP2/ERF domain-containing protein n=1 Tax=Brachypodium distachyon TaxID=15368 RepID=I1HV24_BRADI|nr:dehydration-responsive element-binding protein 1H [Brachypodium distachyon]KQK11454.1 hypothetical protein BRADI_2g60331v3 [Brachypodium distachyon]|eukprot:XP_003567456.1 dehydration-responsive element-binding protein 1H [Brachypodium distachyon]